MEENFYEEDSPKHLFVKCMFILFLIGVLGGVFIYYKKVSTISLKTITIEAGSELSNNIDDYLKNSHKYSYKFKLYLNNVDTNKVGKYTYKIRYNKHTKKGYIKVVDTTKPKVTIDESITIGNNDEFDPNVFILKCEDYSLPCKAELKNKSDYDKIKNIGTYKLEIIISDNAKNKITKEVELIVSNKDELSSAKNNDLEYYSNSVNDDSLGHTFFLKFDKAINEDTKEYETKVLEVSSTDFSKYVDKDIYSTRVITAYNKYGYVIGIQVEVTFNDGTKKLIKDKVEE